jgi:cytochrome c biogenesis protein CcmG/thiol:disulfide interchange protein DsbE
VAADEALPSDGPAERGGRGRAIVIAVIIVGAVVGVGWAALKVMGGGELGQDPFGQAAPNFEMPLLSGDGNLTLSDLKGKPVILNFWASWCGPCKDEAPVLAAAEKEWRSKGVVFLGVDSEDTRAAAQEFEASFGIRYDSVFDEQGRLEVQYGVLGFPETFFIDRDGTIRAKYVGPIDAEDLDAYLASITA